MTKKQENAKYNKTHKEQIRKHNKACYDSHKPYYHKQSKEYKQRLRMEVLGIYSNQTFSCACCGDSHLQFLTIDHINNDGKEHRKQIGGVGMTYLWLRKNNYPAGFQVLCYNCNNGKRVNRGVCPHCR
jgi:hypothetical protein